MISVHSSATKHAISADDSIEAATNALWIEPLDEEIPSRELRLGFDRNGRLLEIVVLIFDSGNELIIHAMKARKAYLLLLDI